MHIYINCTALHNNLCQFACLPAYLTVYLSVYLYICLLVLSICLFIFLSVGLYICRPFCLSICIYDRIISCFYLSLLFSLLLYTTAPPCTHFSLYLCILLSICLILFMIITVQHNTWHFFVSSLNRIWITAIFSISGPDHELEWIGVQTGL